MNDKQIEQAKNTYIGRLFTLGGSTLFFIGSLIATIVGYQAYIDAVNAKQTEWYRYKIKNPFVSLFYNSSTYILSCYTKLYKEQNRYSKI